MSKESTKSKEEVEAEKIAKSNEAKLRKEVEKKFGKSEIEQLKKDNPRGINLLRIGDRMAFFKKPNRDIISAASAEASHDEILFSSIVAENCFLVGDRELLDNDDYFLQLAPLLDQMIERKVAQLLKF